jgi:hypothetical protein
VWYRRRGAPSDPRVHLAGEAKPPRTSALLCRGRVKQFVSAAACQISEHAKAKSKKKLKKEQEESRNHHNLFHPLMLQFESFSFELG